MRCAPTSSHAWDFFIKLWLILSQMESLRREIPKYTSKFYHNGKLEPYHLSCFINSFLYHPANTAWLFEKIIFELEAFYSFKITYILLRQVISLKKNGRVPSKIYRLILWSLICTPLILVSASVKMAGSSVTVIYNSIYLFICLFISSFIFFLFIVDFS